MVLSLPRLGTSACPLVLHLPLLPVQALHVRHVTVEPDSLPELSSHEPAATQPPDHLQQIQNFQRTTSQHKSLKTIFKRTVETFREMVASPSPTCSPAVALPLAMKGNSGAMCPCRSRLWAAVASGISVQQDHNVTDYPGEICNYDMFCGYID